MLGFYPNSLNNFFSLSSTIPLRLWFHLSFTCKLIQSCVIGSFHLFLFLSHLKKKSLWKIKSNMKRRFILWDSGTVVIWLPAQEQRQKRLKLWVCFDKFSLVLGQEKKHFPVAKQRLFASFQHPLLNLWIHCDSLWMFLWLCPSLSEA